MRNRQTGVSKRKEREKHADWQNFYFIIISVRLFFLHQLRMKEFIETQRKKETQGRKLERNTICFNPPFSTMKE